MSIKCPECPEVFETKKVFKNHKKTFHSPWCTVCQKYFDAVDHLKKHNKIFHTPTPCPTCSEVLPSETEMLKHKKLAHPKCDACQKVFKDHNRFEAHNNEVHMTFKCTACPKGFPDHNALNVHQKTSHDWCTVCNEMFPTEKELKYHNMALHSPRKCNVCESIFPDKRAMNEHVANTHPPWCFDCNQPFKKFMSLHKHVRFMHEEQKCRKCPNETFDSIVKLKRHKRAVHKMCDVCHKSFHDEKSLMEHEKTSHKAYHLPKNRLDMTDIQLTYFWCTKCQNIFKDHRSRKEHNLIHHPKPSTIQLDPTKPSSSRSRKPKPYRCSVCSDQFCSKGCVKGTKKPPTSESIKCSECPASFSTVKEYEKHSLLHPRCKVCLKFFKNQLQFNIHKSIKCSRCSDVFCTDDALERHKQSVHYWCKFCSNIFSTAENLQAHQAAHQRFQCTDCLEKFRTQKILEEHQKSSHPWCGVCKKTFEDLQKHNTIFHNSLSCL